jgi:aryl-alcohol dehydrogenase-like predicted oxidoreductase
MKYHLPRRTGLRVSELGFGGGSIGGILVGGEYPPMQQVVIRAIAMGIAHFDPASLSGRRVLPERMAH